MKDNIIINFFEDRIFSGRYRFQFFVNVRDLFLKKLEIIKQGKFIKRKKRNFKMD